MERLTERYGDGYIHIKGRSSCYKDVERKSAPASNAIVRLAAYEDTGLSPEEIVAMEAVFLEGKLAEVESVNGVPIERVIQLVEAEKEKRSNVPLTLEELREMDGEPVWVVAFLNESFWGLVRVWGESDKLEVIRADHLAKDARWYGRTDILPGWLAYHRKPEEGTT